MLRSHEDLVRGQQRLIVELGNINRELLGTRDVPSDRALKLVEEYQRLVREQGELVKRFEGLVQGVRP